MKVKFLKSLKNASDKENNKISITLTMQLTKIWTRENDVDKDKGDDNASSEREASGENQSQVP